MKNKKVYIALSVDFVHHGHINLIQKAKKLGTVTLGLLTDKAISSKKELPYLNYNQRLQIVENFNGIVKVVPQNEWDYSNNILKIKPDFFVHGDDWNFNGEIDLKKSALKALKKVSGKLIEIEHVKDISSSSLKKKSTNVGGTPDVRRSSLKRLFNSGKFLKFIEVHSPISAIIAENTLYKESNKISFYDGFWSSSLTDSTLRGKPDIEILDLRDRLQNINDNDEVIRPNSKIISKSLLEASLKHK